MLLDNFGVSTLLNCATVSTQTGRLRSQRESNEMAVTLVEKYNPDCPKWFEEIKAILGEKTSRVCIQIEHVSSMSIPGMTAEPIIDLTLVIEPQDFDESKALLVERGYCHHGDKGIKDWEAFRLGDVSVKTAIPPHHLYVCPKQSTEFREETAFRDFIRHTKQYAERLSDLKWSLAEAFNNDREA